MESKIMQTATEVLRHYYNGGSDIIETLDEFFYSHDVSYTLSKDKNLVILNYRQDTDKVNPVTNQCRGLVLSTQDWSPVAVPFSRFFNYYKNLPEHKTFFDHGAVDGYTKIDGSLMIVYFYENQWRANTRKTFGDGPVYNGMTWQNIFFKIFGQHNLSLLNPDLTYLFELQTPWTQVVQYVPEPKITLLSQFDKNGNEHATIYKFNNVYAPEHKKFFSLQEVLELVQKESEKDPCFEGFVLRNNLNHRMKIKSESYLNFHRICTTNLSDIKLIDLYCNCDDMDELQHIAPHLKERLNNIRQVEEKIEKDFFTLCFLVKSYSTKKEAYLAVKESWLADLVMRWFCSRDLYTPAQFLQSKTFSKKYKANILKKVWMNDTR